MRYENSFLFQKFFSKFSVYSRSASIISLAFSAARSFDCAQDDNHLRHRMTILSFRAPLTFYTLPLSQIPLSFCTLPLSRTPLSFCALPLFQTPLTFCTLPLSRTPLSFCAFAQHTSVILCVCAAHLCHSVRLRSTPLSFRACRGISSETNPPACEEGGKPLLHGRGR